MADITPDDRYRIAVKVGDSRYLCGDKDGHSAAIAELEKWASTWPWTDELYDGKAVLAKLNSMKAQPEATDE